MLWINGAPGRVQQKRPENKFYQKLNSTYRGLMCTWKTRTQKTLDCLNVFEHIYNEATVLPYQDLSQSSETLPPSSQEQLCPGPFAFQNSHEWSCYSPSIDWRELFLCFANIWSEIFPCVSFKSSTEVLIEFLVTELENFKLEVGKEYLQDLTSMALKAPLFPMLSLK